MKIILASLSLTLLCGCNPTNPKSPQSANQLGQSSKRIERQADTSNVDQPSGRSSLSVINPVPTPFKNVDFKNRSYGMYRFDSGRRIDLTLRDGHYERYPESAGWFELKDVYYTDLTNDGVSEAIVIIWHVTCGGSCDGGAALIYVYQAHVKRLQPILIYETGTTAYGCGLKSLSVTRQKLTLELFGRCGGSRMEYSGTGKFMVSDTTRLTLRFNGKRIIRTKTKFEFVPERDVKNYEPEIKVGA